MPFDFSSLPSRSTAENQAGKITSRTGCGKVAETGTRINEIEMETEIYAGLRAARR
jgi:hypothetical protein